MTTTDDIVREYWHNEIPLDTVAQPLRSLIEVSNRNAEKKFRARGFVSPQWHAITDENRALLILDPPSDDKDLAAVLVRASLTIHRATAVVFTDEAWRLMIDNAGEPLSEEQWQESERARTEGLAAHPRRQEAIIFVCEDAAGNALAGERVITRPARGKAKLAPLLLFRPRSGEGRFATWLTPQGRPS